MNQKYHTLVELFVLVLLVLALLGWASSLERKHAPELQNARRDNADANVVSGSVKAGISGEKVADFLEAICSYDGEWNKRGPSRFCIFSSMDELDGIKLALEARGWNVKEAKSPWPAVFLFECSHPEKGYRINIGYPKEDEQVLGQEKKEEQEGEKTSSLAGTPRGTWQPDTITPAPGMMAISRPPIDDPFNSTVTHPWPPGRGPVMEAQGAMVLSQGESRPPIDEGLSSLISAVIFKSGGTQVPLLNTPPSTPPDIQGYIAVLNGP